MARPLQPLLSELHRIAADDVVSDHDLLRRFVAQRDAAAFELLVWRHGRLVSAVCRRTLRNSADADDAFQATFLALLRQAHAVRGPSLAPWLHRVAHRVARRAARHAAERRHREQHAARPEFHSDPAHDTADLGPLLHEEIERLPERFRVPFVLCYLDGKTNDEAAALLGCPTGTVQSRLSRARERLRSRLTRRGVTLASGVVLLAAGDEVAAGLVSATVRTATMMSDGPAADALLAPAVALSREVVQDMTLSKIKLAACATVIVAMLGVGVGMGQRPTTGASPDETPKSAATDEKKLNGTWIGQAVGADGKSEASSEYRLTFTDDRRLIMRRHVLAAELRYKLSPDKKPATIDTSLGNDRLLGIYELNGDALKICFAPMNGDRPTRFVADGSSKQLLLELKRESAVRAPVAVTNPPTAEEHVKLKQEYQKVLAVVAAQREQLAQLHKQMENVGIEAQKAKREANEMRDRAVASEIEAKRQSDKNERLLLQIEAERARAERQMIQAKKALDELRKKDEKKDPRRP